MSHLERVVVVGNSGSGKTTVARAMAPGRRLCLARPPETHGHVRKKYETAMSDGSWNHATVHRLRKPREVESFLESLATLREN